MLFSSRKTPPYADNLDSDGFNKIVTKPQESPRDTPFGHILVRARTFQIDIVRDGAKRTRPGTDGLGASLEPCPLRDPTNSQRQRTTSFTNRKREANFRCVRTDADFKPAKTPITAY